MLLVVLGLITVEVLTIEMLITVGSRGRGHANVRLRLLACMHVCTMYVCKCVCMPSNKFCMYIHMQACMYVYECEYMYVFVYVFVYLFVCEHHYSDEMEMDHTRDLCVDGFSREDIDEISDSEDGG